jgi:predicted nucleic acid-binding Zn ribbon protein
MTNKQKYCKNCGSKIESGLYCSEVCNELYNRKPKGAKPLEAQEEKKKRDTKTPIEEHTENNSVNIGTYNKRQLQQQSIIYFRTYPKNKTAKQYAYRLSWDINTTYKTALENYIRPMIEQGILISSGDNCFKLNPEYEKGDSNE